MGWFHGSHETGECSNEEQGKIFAKFLWTTSGFKMTRRSHPTEDLILQIRWGGKNKGSKTQAWCILEVGKKQEKGTGKGKRSEQNLRICLRIQTPVGTELSPPKWHHSNYICHQRREENVPGPRARTSLSPCKSLSKFQPFKFMFHVLSHSLNVVIIHILSLSAFESSF